ncbi:MULTISPECIES: P52 family lipoprotein [Borreliella]|uniref:Uncharacterized protein n=1 Tax=Borreliella mayonii TaxID=1674146 RepID=A0AAC9KYC6_9SPIR|nr:MULTISPECIES: P52 family lipoprotein [Borreliella]ACN55796.1 conserved hypothetical protein [Borreliella burgdorferi WI91-23]APT00453.1 hypothetical protein Bmayo_05255 [Borreliella mayonii]EEC21399.1 conserved hypothetical protein [Borreliella burgdorferi 156a]MCD2320816.1 P52 family lipoprotein [Borreliella burgdorferi]MCD2379939.1 P52 family lipoprotein [Borreliella burgdorferi]
MENIFEYLKLNAVEICVLKDIKKVIYKFYESILDIENDAETINILSPHKSQNILNEFFFNLGPKKSKELINLFRKIKVKLGDNVFENKVFIFYLCLDDVDFFKLLYVLDKSNFDDYLILIYEKFLAIRKDLKLILNNYGSNNL